MRQETVLEKKISTSCSKRVGNIKYFLKSASEQEKIKFFDDMYILQAMLRHSASVSERMLIFIDNNIIQDILKREVDPDRNRRFHSFIATLALVQDYYLLDLFACISPAVLFEAGGKRTNYTLAQAEALISSVIEAMACVGLATHFVGFNGARELLNIFKKIAYDEVQIRKAIDEINSRNWDRDFAGASKYGLGIRIPLSLAEEECPNVRLSYFRKGVVKWILMHMIEKRMYRENKDQPKARNLMYKGDGTVFSILKPKDGGVEGLGDIELLTYCDLASQTMNNSPEITVGLTYDKRLCETLLERLNHVTIGPSFQSGSDKPADASQAFIWSYRQSEKRTRKANRRMREYRRAFREFHDEVLKDFLQKNPVDSDNPIEA